MYLIDYDIPAELRHQFYYDLRRNIIKFLLDGVEDMVRRKQYKKMGLKQLLEKIGYVKSSRSVILVNDRKVAYLIHQTAKKYGYSNLFEVKKIE